MRCSNRKLLIVFEGSAQRERTIEMDQIFMKINIQNICGHKSETMECIELKICMSDKHHRYYKHTKFRQNPRGDPKFLVDLT